MNLFLQGPPQPGQPFKFTVGESCDRIKEEFNFLQAQYHNLKLECEKLASEKIEIQRHYVMRRTAANYLEYQPISRTAINGSSVEVRVNTRVGLSRTLVRPIAVFLQRAANEVWITAVIFPLKTLRIHSLSIAVPFFLERVFFDEDSNPQPPSY
ncbi:hypothetical protein Zmor_000346 [Zophobas morio]|uniref:Groucho/TLE N-terminal Q-rich domain-containing protein n=1 Tax=Zophobas morio TaxID=2755281 RepID=A0AA38IZV9_9CUCU|nr:hypothetical protein Zmor_000346 [Zophobas morio]